MGEYREATTEEDSSILLELSDEEAMDLWALILRRIVAAPVHGPEKKNLLRILAELEGE